MLTVLSVAYALAPVSVDAAGGAEQVLSLLDRALVKQGHRSIVIACDGSQVAGELVRTDAELKFDEAANERAWKRIRDAIETVRAKEHVDIIHLHGLDFLHYLPAAGPAVLATLHLPPDWYPPETFAIARPRTYLHCVSESQQRARPEAANFLPFIENGVDLESLRTHVRRRSFALALGRICPEKGFDIAARAANRAHTTLFVAGEVFPYEAHETYARECLFPLLTGRHRFLGPVGMGRKRRLLSAARCLLAPSRVAETSSLVAMEALACGTPVIAFRAGALAEIVEDGKTGYLVQDEREMAEAMRCADRIDADACRAAAAKRFSADRVAREYLDRYGELSRREENGREMDLT